MKEKRLEFRGGRAMALVTFVIFIVVTIGLSFASGAAFGDNCAPVSDTTIIAATSQEYKYKEGAASIGGTVKSRYRYVLTAGVIAVVLFFIFGGSGGVIDPAEAAELLAQYQRPLGLLLLIPTCVVIFMAVRGINIFACLGTGSVLAVIIGLAAGLFNFSRQIPSSNVS